MSLTIAAVVFALALGAVTTAPAQEPTPLDVTFLTCVGPGYIPDGDPYEVIAGLPEKNCIRACKFAAQGCKAVVKSIDRCGVSFLKAAAKTGMEICRGSGGTSQECRVIRDIVKPDIDWWKAAGKFEQAECVAEMEANCLPRCG